MTTDNFGKTVSASAVIFLSMLAVPAAHSQPASGSTAPAGQTSGGQPPAMGAGMMNKPGMGGGQMDMKAMDMKGMMSAQNDKMATMTMTGNPDVDFAMMMRIHHQGAIDMAEAQLKNGKSPEMKKMATKIIADQKKEIARFDAFLSKSGHSMDKMKK